MFAKVHFGYLDGVPRASHYSQFIYGQMFSEIVRGRDVIHLWPYDLPYTAIDKNSKPLASLWRPTLTGVLQTAFGISGVERLKRGGRSQWVAQRWLCEPTTYADIHQSHSHAKLRLGCQKAGAGEAQR